MAYPKSDHCDGERFHNPSGIPLQPFSKLPKLLREPRTRWPRWIDEPQRKPPSLEGADAAVTFVGHATFLIQTRIGNVLTDPMWSMRAGPFGLLGPRRVRRPGVAFEDLPRIDVVLLSHGHYDHLDLPTLRALGHGVRLLVPEGHAGWLARRGFRNVTEVAWWQAVELAPGVAAVATPAQHFTARTPFDRNRAHWCGWWIEGAGKRLWHAGDTACCPAFAEIGERLGPIDFGMIPIGAYAPRWVMKGVHLSPEEAVEVFLQTRCRRAVGMHWGTFRLTDEPMGEPPPRLRAAAAARGMETFETWPVGGTAELA